MIKKNILPVFLLALVVLLSVFYVKQANDDVEAGIVDNNQETVLSDFAVKRLEVLEARSEEVEELESSIASGTLKEDEITDVIEKINEIYYLKYTEVELEDAISLLGYSECLVIINDYAVEVSVEANEITTQDFIEITNLVKGKLSNSYKVSVSKVTKDN